MNTSFLENIGLSKKESVVYIALLELGTSKASDIALKSRMHRPHVYNILKSLEESGLVLSDQINGVLFYKPEDPKKLLTIIKIKEENISQALPLLESFYNLNPIKPKIRYFEGITGIRQVMEEPINILKKGTEYYRINTDQSKMANLVGIGWWKSLAQKRIVTGLPIKVIIDKSNSQEVDLIRTDKESLRHVRCLSKSIHIPARMQIYGDRIAIFDIEKPLVLVIQSENIANLQKILFQSLWDKCEELGK